MAKKCDTYVPQCIETHCIEKPAQGINWIGSANGWQVNNDPQGTLQGVFATEDNLFCEPLHVGCKTTFGAHACCAADQELLADATTGGIFGVYIIGYSREDQALPWSAANRRCVGNGSRYDGHSAGAAGYPASTTLHSGELGFVPDFVRLGVWVPVDGLSKVCIGKVCA